MIRRLRKDSGGGASFEAAQAAISRGMADLLAGLDNVIDDDAALGRVYAGLASDLEETARVSGSGSVVEEWAPIGMLGLAVATTRASGPSVSRRRLAVRSVAAAMVAALAAGASAVALRTIAAPSPGRNGTAGPTDRGSYVVKRVGSALLAAEPGEVGQMTVTTLGTAQPGGTTATTTSEEWSHGDQWRSVTTSSAGHPVYDEGSSTTSSFTLVSYLTRTWARQPGLGRPAATASGPGSCEPVVAALPLLFQPRLPGTGFSASSPLTVAGDLRAAVSCAVLAVAGRQRVDGIEAIQLTSRPGSKISETIWVSPSTYLPVRVIIRPAPTKPQSMRADITWLPVTAQNLAILAVPVPAGFRHVRLVDAVSPVSHQTPG
jgi:hypothetical protein